MNANAKKWVEALRSGKYEQVRGALFSDTGLCCLGVGLVVAEKSGAIDSARVCGIGLTKEAMDWFGLQAYDGQYKDGTLMNDNDYRQLSFAQIADIIESEPEGLFA